MKDNIFKEPILDIIKNRTSVRGFSDKEVSTNTINDLVGYISNMKSPYENNVRFEFLVEDSEIKKLGGKVGTYGVIKGAKNYIAIIGDKGKDTLYQIGYMGESLVIYLTSLGLGSCWMGGTYDKGSFNKRLKLKDNEKLYIVIPFGYPLDKRSRVDYFMRFAARSNQRKSWEEIFFKGNYEQPLLEDEEQYLEALEGLRMSPSASNKQPWVVIKKGHYYDFYLKPTTGYGDALGFKIQEIDIGIAMFHFEAVLKDHGIKGKWEKTTNKNSSDEKLVYVTTWIEEGR